VIIERGKSGSVFSASSITWVSALLTDDAISTITRNVVHRFLSEGSA
jgi:hypothetical protein